LWRKSWAFEKPAENSIDAVSNRDYVVELASHLSLLMAHLSRLGEEVVLYTSQEFAFLKLDDAFCHWQFADAAKEKCGRG